MNPNMVKAQIKLHGDTYESLAKKLGVTRRSLENKIYEINKFSIDDITKLKEIYDLTPDEVDAIFLTSECH